MSAQVDVLAVMDEFVGVVGDEFGNESGLRLREARDAVAALIAERDALREALHEGRRAIGEHHAPSDCYATGPLTGNEYRDLVQCPACSFIAMHDAALTTGESA